MTIHPNTVYLGDNGRANCGKHLGATAHMTGHDLYGTPLMALTPEVVRDNPEAAEIGCEICGIKPKRVIA